jgi:hypothetical protein
MVDLYRDTCCSACGRYHTLYDTSAVRYPPGAMYSYTCPATRRVAHVTWLQVPEVVAVLPDDAIPIERARV